MPICFQTPPSDNVSRYPAGPLRMPSAGLHRCARAARQRELFRRIFRWRDLFAAVSGMGIPSMTLRIFALIWLIPSRPSGRFCCGSAPRRPPPPFPSPGSFNAFTRARGGQRLGLSTTRPITKRRPQQQQQQQQPPRKPRQASAPAVQLVVETEEKEAEVSEQERQQALKQLEREKERQVRDRDANIAFGQLLSFGAGPVCSFSTHV